MASGTIDWVKKWMCAQLGGQSRHAHWVIMSVAPLVGQTPAFDAESFHHFGVLDMFMVKMHWSMSRTQMEIGMGTLGLAVIP